MKTLLLIEPPSFDAFVTDQPDNGYTLKASAAPGATSTAFNIGIFF